VLPPQPHTQAMYDSIYLETGFNSIEGPGLKEMEQRKVRLAPKEGALSAKEGCDGVFST